AAWRTLTLDLSLGVIPNRDNRLSICLSSPVRAVPPRILATSTHNNSIAARSNTHVVPVGTRRRNSFQIFFCARVRCRGGLPSFPSALGSFIRLAYFFLFIARVVFFSFKTSLVTRRCGTLNTP